MLRLSTLALLAPLALFACVETGSDPEETPEDTGNGQPDPNDTSDTGEPVELPDVSDAITYRDLATHPGYTTDDLTYTPVTLPGYEGSAKEYVGTEDTSKPVVVLVHGNSDSPTTWEAYDSGGLCSPPGAKEGEDMLAEQLVPLGYRVIAMDMRFDKVDDDPVDNPAKNMDHGWGVPLTQQFFEAVLDAYPDRQISVVAHSFGVTVIRDVLRRLYINDGVQVWPRIDDLILLAGANHGVSTFEASCGINPTMAGTVTCEMGSRAAYVPTDFLTPLNGDGGEFETPCSDGASAYGRTDACGGHSIEYTTIVMRDLDNGEQQDAFVSEASSRLEGAENLLIGLQDFDITGYYFPFCGTILQNHFGAARSQAAIDLILAELAD